MKDKFIEELEKKLMKYTFEKDEVEDIISDYGEMYDDKMNHGYQDNEIIEQFGSVDSIVKELKGNHKRKVNKKETIAEKTTGLSVFVAVIIFMILGSFYQLWHPGWLIFLIIPMSAIVSEIIESKYNSEKEVYGEVIGLLFIITTTVFLLLGLVKEVWHPTWLLFMIPTAISVFYDTKNNGKNVFGWSIVLITVLYFLLIQFRADRPIYLLLFIVPIAIGIYYGFIDIVINEKKNGKIEVILLFSIVALYFILNSVFHIWHISWLLFLLFPMMMVLIHGNGKKEKIIGSYVFLSVILFFTLGFAFHLWAVAWLVYLGIPILGILLDE